MESQRNNINDQDSSIHQQNDENQDISFNLVDFEDRKQSKLVVSSHGKLSKKNHDTHHVLEITQADSKDSFSLAIVYLIRLLILGIGLGAIAGTTLSSIDFTNPKYFSFLFNESSSSEKAKTPEILSTSETSETSETPEISLSSSLSNFSLGNDLPALKEKLEKLALRYPHLKPGAFFIDLDNGNYVNLGGDIPYSAASTIKTPILIALFEDIDAGKIHLDQQLVMTRELIGGGAGSLQYQKPGSKYSVLETATKMIVISDNTATNMIIDALGGIGVLNERFKSWGLTHTKISNLLPDLKGTNTTSPEDLAKLLGMLDADELVSSRSRDRILAIMRRTRTRTLLPQGLEKGAMIAHKTGDIGTSLGDGGIIDMPNGKRYVGAVLVERPFNDYSARTLIQEMSKTSYLHFKYYLPRPFENKN